MQIYPGTLFLKTLNIGIATKHSCFILCTGKKQLCIKDNHIFLIGEFYKKNGLLNGDFYNHNLMEVVSLFLVMIYVHTMMTQ